MDFNQQNGQQYPNNQQYNQQYSQPSNQQYGQPYGQSYQQPYQQPVYQYGQPPVQVIPQKPKENFEKSKKFTKLSLIFGCVGFLIWIVLDFGLFISAFDLGDLLFNVDDIPDNALTDFLSQAMAVILTFGPSLVIPAIVFMIIARVSAPSNKKALALMISYIVLVALLVIGFILFFFAGMVRHCA